MYLWLVVYFETTAVIYEDITTAGSELLWNCLLQQQSWIMVMAFPFQLQKTSSLIEMRFNLLLHAVLSISQVRSYNNQFQLLFVLPSGK